MNNLDDGANFQIACHPLDIAPDFFVETIQPDRPSQSVDLELELELPQLDVERRVNGPCPLQQSILFAVEVLDQGMTRSARKPTKVDTLGGRVEQVDKFRALEEDCAVDGERETVCELDADDRAAEGSGNTTRISKSNMNNKGSNTNVRYLEPGVKSPPAIAGFFGAFHRYASESSLKPTEFDTVQRLQRWKTR